MKRRYPAFFTMVLFLTAATLPDIASAQSRSGGRPENRLRFETFYLEDSDFDVEGDTGSFRVFGGLADVKIGWFTAEYGYRQYEWEDVARLPFGDGVRDPWEELHRVGVGFSHDEMVSETWGYFVSGQATAAFEEEMDDSFGFGGWGGLLYRVRSWETTFRLGAAYSWDEVTSRVLPIVGFSWRNPGARGLSASLGIPVTAATYRVSEAFAIRAGLAFDFDTYRLADDSPVSSAGYLESEYIGGEVSLLFNLSPAVRLDVSGAWFFDSQLTLHDSDGENGVEYDVDPGAAARVGLSFSF